MKTYDDGSVVHGPISEHDLDAYEAWLSDLAIGFGGGYHEYPAADGKEYLVGPDIRNHFRSQSDHNSPKVTKNVD